MTSCASHKRFCPPGGHVAGPHPPPPNTVFPPLLRLKPYKGRVEKAKVQRATGEFLLKITLPAAAADVELTDANVLLQKDPFIQMYEERAVDVAGYVCRLLDQMPASPSSPTYMD